jgi:hypothetical protein
MMLGFFLRNIMNIPPFMISVSEKFKFSKGICLQKSRY